MAVGQRLIEMSAVDIIRHNTCGILESFLIGDQALAFWTLLYRATDGAAVRIEADDAPEAVLAIFVDEFRKAYDNLTGDVQPKPQSLAPVIGPEAKVRVMPELSQVPTPEPDSAEV